MRKAVNYVIDRTTMAAVSGPTLWQPTDQLLPPGMPGFDDQQIYPNQADIEQARDLAGWHPGDPMRYANVYYRSSGTIQPALAQVVRADCSRSGSSRPWCPSQGTPSDAASRPRASHSTSQSAWVGARTTAILEPHPDPEPRTTIHDGGGNINGHANNPVFNAAYAAEQLVGQPRYAAFGESTST
jgi:ABC-type transport system substrate-binding protein